MNAQHLFGLILISMNRSWSPHTLPIKTRPDEASTLLKALYTSAEISITSKATAITATTSRLITTSRFWSPHILPIKDWHVLESFTCLRVATTGSLGRSVVIYDVYQATVVLRLSFPVSIESLLTCNSTQDFLYAGSPLSPSIISSTSP